jgi:hypothetical protein
MVETTRKRLFWPLFNRSGKNFSFENELQLCRCRQKDTLRRKQELKVRATVEPRHHSRRNRQLRHLPISLVVVDESTVTSRRRVRQARRRRESRLV